MNSYNYEISVGPSGVLYEQVYPCRCGDTHRGPYAAYDAAQHECLHDADLHELAPDHLMCPDCGKAWTVYRAPLTRWQMIVEYLKALYR